MTLKHEYAGKDVDEAIRNACAGLSLDRDQLDIEVVHPGSAGIFGLCAKKARIRVSRRARCLPEETLLAAKAEPAKHTPPEQAIAPAAKQPAREKTRRSSGGGEERRKDESGRGRSRKHEPVAASRPKPVEEIDLPAEAADEARRELVTLLGLMGLQKIEAAVIAEGGVLRARIEGDDAAVFAGDDGQLLDSIQYLLRKILSKKFCRKIAVNVDAGEYRLARRQELENLALQLAAEVKESGKSRTLPMALNPAERRIVHMAIQDDAEIRSRSVGEGVFKKVLIYQPGNGGGKPSRRRGRGGSKPKPRGDAAEA